MPAEPWKRSSNEGENIVAALKHPLRRQLLAAIGEEQISPVQLHRRLRTQLSNVAYHVRALEFFGMAEQVEQRPVRGSVQHFYVITPLGKRALAFGRAAGMIDERDEKGEDPTS